MDNYEFWDELGKIFNAVVAYQEKSIEFNKRFINPWIRLGNVFDKQDRNKEAISTYQHAIEIDPCNAQNWYELGNVYFRMETYDESVDAYTKAIELDPESGWFYNNLALTYVTQGKFTEAIPLYQKSVELLAEAKDKAVAWNRLGNAYRKINEYDLAVAAFQNADELDGENAGFRDELDDIPDEPTLADPSIQEQTDVEAIPTPDLDQFQSENVLETDPTSIEALQMSTQDVEGSILVTPLDEVDAGGDELPLAQAVMEASAEEVQIDLTDLETQSAGAEQPLTSDSETVLSGADDQPAQTAADPGISDILTDANAGPEDADTPVVEVSSNETAMDETASGSDAAGPPSESLESSPQDDPTVDQGNIEIIVNSDLVTGDQSSTVSPTQPELDSDAGVPGIVAAGTMEAVDQTSDPAEPTSADPGLLDSYDPEIDGMTELELSDSEETLVVELASWAATTDAIAEPNAATPISEEAAYEEFLEDNTEVLDRLTLEATPELSEELEPAPAQEPIAKINSAGDLQIEVDTKNAHVWNELGNVYFNARSFDDAIVAYSKAIELDRWFAWPYSNLALAYVQKSRFAEAILLYQRSIELFSGEKDKAISWNRLGNVYRRLNDYDNAISAYQRADELDPDNTTLSLQSRFSLLGNYYAEQKPTYVS